MGFLVLTGHVLIIYLCFLFQDQIRQQDHALDVVNGELESEAGRRAGLEKKIAELVEKLGEVAEENSLLRQEMEEHETSWTEQRDKLQEDSNASNAKYTKLVAFLSEIITALFGKPALFLTIAYHNLFFRLTLLAFLFQGLGTPSSSLSRRGSSRPSIPLCSNCIIELARC